MEESAEKQHKKQSYDWLKGYRFVKGVSGNPGGRPKGKSLKTFAREYLETLDDDEKIKFLSALPEEIVWKMAEGLPQSDDKLNVSGSLVINVAESVAKKHDITPLSPESSS